MNMPGFGQADNPHATTRCPSDYLEHGEEETGSANVVTAMILSYRGFDTLGESCVLFLAVASGDDAAAAGREEHRRAGTCSQMEQEEAIRAGQHQDLILKQVARVSCIPFIFLFAIYVLLNGETSPGGGFSGGTILGGGTDPVFRCLWLRTHCGCLMNQQDLQRGADLRPDAVCCAVRRSTSSSGPTACPTIWPGMILLIDLAVGLVVACTVYGFYALFSRGEI